jgi:membrane protease YdiL (CAAX protease family)
MDVFYGIGILICFGVLVAQFYIVGRQGYLTTADVAANGGSLRLLNRRHAVSAAAMAVPTLYFGFAKKEWLLLGAPHGAQVAVLLCILGGAAFAVSLTAATQAVRKLKPGYGITSAAETYLFLRALFLIFYEFFFRAILLNYCMALMDVPLAVVINVLLYVAAHLFSTRQELFGSLPFGILLCGVTLYTNSIWPAVLLHLLLGMPYDMYLLSASKLSTKTYTS